MTAPAGSSELPLTDRRFLQKLGAEWVGTCALVAVGCGAIMVNAETGALGHLGVSLAFGLVVSIMILATGHLSGAHLNPAVTVAFAVFGRFPWRHVPAYVTVQASAALAGAGLLRLGFGDVASMGATRPSGSMGQAFLFEVALTFLLMFVIKAVATDTRAEGQHASLAIGGAVAICAMVGGPVCGASMNPARSLGPALVSGDLSSLWIYLSAPVLGAILGALAYEAVRCHDETGGDVKGCC